MDASYIFKVAHFCVRVVANKSLKFFVRDRIVYFINGDKFLIIMAHDLTSSQVKEIIEKEWLFVRNCATIKMVGP